MIIGERVGNTHRMRLRDRLGTTAIAETSLTTTLAASIKVILGQDEIPDGHALSAPSAARSWSEHVYEMALYNAPCLSNATTLAMWDDYFTAVYQGE